MEPTKTCVCVPLPSAESNVMAVPLLIVFLQYWKDVVVEYLQVTMILHLYKTPGHKCLVICDGIGSVNRVSLISVHTSAESSLSHSMLRLPEYIFLPDCFVPALY